MKNIIMIAALFSSAAMGSFVVSDSTQNDPSPTHCGWFLDGVRQGETVAPVDEDGFPYCQYGLSWLKRGTHSIAATFIAYDEEYGQIESPQSDVIMLKCLKQGLCWAVPQNIKIVP